MTLALGVSNYCGRISIAQIKNNNCQSNDLFEHLKCDPVYFNKQERMALLIRLRVQNMYINQYYSAQWLIINVCSRFNKYSL